MPCNELIKVVDVTPPSFPSVSFPADAQVTPETWLQTYVDEYRQLPVPEHLTKFVKNRGGILSYSAAKSVIQETRLLDADASFLDALDNAVKKLEHLPRQVPVPLAAPRDARGRLMSEDEYDDYEPMDLHILPSSAVLLNVYDEEDDLLQTINRWGLSSESVNIGDFHVAVQIYGQEWSFGATEIEGVGVSGIYSCPPRSDAKRKYRCTIDLGCTEISEEEVANLTQRMRCSNTWQGFAHDNWEHNCLHFASSFCNDLGVDGLPAWLTRGTVRSENIAEQWSHAKESARTTLLSARKHVAESAPEIGARVRRWSSGFFKAAMHHIGDGANVVKEAFTFEDEYSKATGEDEDAVDMWGVMKP